MSKLKILIIGSINIDYVCTLAELPQKGETLLASSFVESSGGKGANQAVAAQRLGAEVTMIGAVGKDAVGNKLIDNLRKEGINVDSIKSVDVPTGNAIITVDKNGDNTIVVYSGANFEVDEEFINSCETVIEENDFIILQLEIPMKTVLHSAKLAKKYGKKVILNPAPAKELPKEIYEYIDYITPNETELARITGINDIKEASKELINRGAKNVVVTLGEKGSYYLGESELEVGSFKIDAVDTTAAGDSFNGALAVAIGEGKSIEEALKYANAVGALTTTKIGAQVSLPYKEEVEKFLK